MSSSRKVSVTRIIKSTPEAIFAIIDNPTKHPLIDGSDSVKGSRVADQHLKTGDSFAMDMKIIVPYRITNKVVEYEANRLLAWAHFGGHRWRFELEAVHEGTKVTETFDWSTSKAPWFIELKRYPKSHPAGMEKTLDRLAALVETAV